MTDQFIKSIIEAALFAAGKSLTIDHLLDLFPETEQPERSAIRAILKELREEYAERGIELVQVASGYRFQTKQNLTPWLKRLQPERSPRYSRTLLETIAIIAYRQPITRSEIEKIRGVSVSTDLIKRLQDYNWIRILAHKNSPGRPALYGTTREFLNYFNLKTLNELPPLAELREMVELQTELLDSENKEKDGESEVIESKDNEMNLSASEVLDSEDKALNSAAQEALASEQIDSNKDKAALNLAAQEAIASEPIEESENLALNPAAQEALASEPIDSNKDKAALNLAAQEALASEPIDSNKDKAALNLAAQEALASEPIDSNKDKAALNLAAQEAIASEPIDSNKDKAALNLAAQ
ncbi:MAG: SMC-Scp complex subunit ScpB, partial [Candidatus Parabeggiatoa sp. nov. 2]